MAPRTTIEDYLFEKRFFALPRELRDLIYANVYANLEPVALEHVHANPAYMTLFTVKGHNTDPESTAEALEAFYTHNTFAVTFSDPADVGRASLVKWSPHPQYHKYIRKLVVHAQEARLGETASLEALEHKCLDWGVSNRMQWEGLLKLPRLERLVIQLQKEQNDLFSWADFSPVLVELGEKLPQLRIVFNISFDTLLERYWTDPIWEGYADPDDAVGDPYIPMGFVNVTELIEPPTEADVTYVRENLPEQGETLGRNISRGLLNETPSQRRALALHYVVKEPELLRVRMMEHYGVYQRLMEAEVNHNFVSA